MHLVQSLKSEFCFDLPLFSKYPATSINTYFYKMTLHFALLRNKCSLMHYILRPMPLKSSTVKTNNAFMEFNQSLQDCRIHFLIPNFILSLQEKQT